MSETIATSIAIKAGLSHRLLPLAILVTGAAVVLGYATGGANTLLGLGYPGLFLSALISSAAMIVPIPLGSAAIGLGVFIEAPFNIPPYLLVGLIAGSGSALGELTGFIAGRSGRGYLGRSRLAGIVHHGMERWGPLAVFTFAIIPNPFLDIVGIAAGCAGMPARTFLLSVWPGKMINYTVTALLFMLGADWLTAIF